MRAVFWKELADQFSSRRFLILFLLIALAGLWAAYVAGQSLRAEVEKFPTEFVFLRLFTTQSSILPPFFSFLSFFGPLVGVVLGFDAINSERSRGTLSRVLAQPVYRDAVINGKFLAGLTTIAVMLLSLFLLISGFGLVMLGFPPSSQEIGRLLLFLLVAVVYVGFWLAVSTLFSVLFPRAVLSALASIGLWLFFSFFILMIAGSIADFAVKELVTVEDVIRRVQVEEMLLRFSPATLFSEATVVLLTPMVRVLSGLVLQDVSGLMPTPLSLTQSLILVWPHLVGLIALTAICFAISYARFMREEIRA